MDLVLLNTKWIDTGGELVGIRMWLGNTLFNIDKIVDRKVGERMNNIDSKQTNELLVYRQKENAVWAKGNADRNIRVL